MRCLLTWARSFPFHLDLFLVTPFGTLEFTPVFVRHTVGTADWSVLLPGTVDLTVRVTQGPEQVLQLNSVVINQNWSNIWISRIKKINIQMNSKILIFWQFSWMSCYKIFSISFLTTTCSYKLKKKYCTFEILNACRWIHTVLLSANYYMQVHPTNSKLYSNCFCQPLTWHLTDI